LLSIVGAEGLAESGYMRAKVAQERIVVESGLPYTIVQSTQFHEFAAAITSSLTREGIVRVPDALIQPIAADEVAAPLACVAAAKPHNGVVTMGGPDRMSFAEMAFRVVVSRDEDTMVAVDPAARYFGAPLETSSLVTRHGAVLGITRFVDWLGCAATTSE